MINKIQLVGFLILFNFLCIHGQQYLSAPNEPVNLAIIGSELRGPVRTLLAVEVWGVDIDGEKLRNTVAETFTPDGRRVESIYHSAAKEPDNGKIIRGDYVSTYSYDPATKLLKITHTELDGSIRGVSVRQYNTNSRLSEETTYVGDMKLLDRSTFSYDDAESTTTETRISYAEGKQTQTNKTISRTNAKGWMIERVSYRADGQVDNRSTYEYDDKGNLTKQVSFTSGSSNSSYIHLFDYKFDAHGNWIERRDTLVTNGRERKEWSIGYRTITYYQS